MIQCKRLVGALVALTLAPAALAGSIAPDYRGDPNSVHACFDWVTNDPPGAWMLSAYNTVGTEYPLDDTQPSASDNGQDVVVILPNFIDPLPIKYMRIAMFFDGEVDISNIEFLVNAFDSEETGVVETFRTGGATNVHYIDFEIRPNPDWEEIFIFGSTAASVIPGNLFRIEVDTVSVPTPGATGLAGAACLIALVRRRR